MAALSTAAATALLKLLLNATPYANWADNAASSPWATLYISLHTADPGVGGSQQTSEAAYTSYARVAITRNNGSPGWTVVSASASPVATISFPAATGGSETETFAAIGTASSGVGTVLAKGAISPTIVVSNGVTPQLPTSGTFTLS